MASTDVYSPVAAAKKGLDDDRQLVLDDVQVAGHGCRDTNNSVGKRFPWRRFGAARRPGRYNSTPLPPALAATLTSDVLHGDGAGSGELPRHPEGFVPELLVHQRA